MVERDEWLEPVADRIYERHERYMRRMEDITRRVGSIVDYANGYMYYGWQRDEELWQLTAPFDLRPQGQDIIRTWLFSTMLRSTLEDGRAPWKNAAISGFTRLITRPTASRTKNARS